MGKAVICGIIRSNIFQRRNVIRPTLYFQSLPDSDSVWYNELNRSVRQEAVECGKTETSMKESTNRT